MEAPIDLALNASLWAYDHGRKDRKEKLVIKTRKGDGSTSSKGAKATLQIEDKTDAGKQWSPEELQVVKVYQSDLVVVVGELLPDDFLNTRSLKMPPRGTPFDPHNPTIVETNAKSSIIVRRLTGRRCNIHLLHDKKDGLCRLSQLPKGAENRIVYYREWVSKEYDAHHHFRTNKWRSNINAFCAQYLEDRDDDFLDIKRTSSQKERTAGPRPTQLDSTISKATAMYQATGSESYLKLASSFTKQAAEQSYGEEVSGVKIQHDIIRNTIGGSNTFSLTDAAEAARACQEVFPPGPPGVEPARIEADLLHQLAKGLRNGALGEIVISENLWQPFITTFCLSRDGKPMDDDQTKIDIKAAYRAAALGMGNIMPPSPLVAIDFGDPKGALLTLTYRLWEEKKLHIRAVEEWLRVEWEDGVGGGVEDLRNLPLVLRQLSSEMDFDAARYAIAEVNQHYRTRYRALAERFLDCLKEEAKGLFELTNMLSE
ncbi:hypothetical protein AK830_g11022 [Neonectria ditissima]|uniref:Uncharacterized protein n=1 Tax=Neonectria ditissima TaxID=78410 RepID=A0A0P7AE78_9HYPO|nr:hypothetical protein AK830_g11022 [Neonectria ditissima]